MVGKKRKRAAGGGLAAAAKATRRRRTRTADGVGQQPTQQDDGQVDSGDEGSSDDLAGLAGVEPSGEEDQYETPDEKRVRLAKEYVGQLGEGRPQEEIQEQLARDVEDKAKRTRVQIEDVKLGEQTFRQKGHRFPVTCVCLSSDDATAYTGGKDCTVVRWDLETGQKTVLPGSRNRFDCGGHFEKVLSVCLVESRSLLVSAGVDRVVRLWDHRAPSRSACSDTLTGHLDAVTGLAADSDGSRLYTASLDKSLRVWDLRTRRCMETHFGHVSGIACMDMHVKGRPVTGGTDNTVRVWNVDKETHVVFNRHSYSVDSVTVADQDRFLSGSQDGHLHLWSLASKKPLATADLGSRSWITALQAVRCGNVVFGGTVDGKLRCWRFSRSVAEGEQRDTVAGKNMRFAEVMPPISVAGCINAIAVGRGVLVCAVGKEHRLGRWYYDRSQKNGLLVMRLSYHEG